jgi:hypothetical protein
MLADGLDALAVAVVEEFLVTTSDYCRITSVAVRQWSE